MDGSGDVSAQRGGGGKKRLAGFAFGRRAVRSRFLTGSRRRRRPRDGRRVVAACVDAQRSPAHLPIGRSIHMNITMSTGTPSISANASLTLASVSEPSSATSMTRRCTRCSTDQWLLHAWQTLIVSGTRFAAAGAPAPEDSGAGAGDGIVSAVISARAGWCAATRAMPRCRGNAGENAREAIGRFSHSRLGTRGG